MDFKKNKQRKVLKNIGAVLVASGVTLGGVTLFKSAQNAIAQENAYDDCVNIVDTVKQSETFLEYYADKYNHLKHYVDSNKISTEDMYAKLNEVLSVEHIYTNRNEIIDSQATRSQLENSYMDFLKYKYKNINAVALSGGMMSACLVGSGSIMLSSAKKEDEEYDKEI
ncbi:MAG: hypothetical protein IJW59_03390 [Clostridia bacterium]|nr:hypothetical protein [Clostridia bacterium]